jgi:hypothetical protein
MRTARWLWATALILSAPAAAIEPDVTGSLPQTRILEHTEVGHSPRFPSISPELLEMFSERVLPTAQGPYTVVQARRVEANTIFDLLLSPQPLSGSAPADRPDGPTTGR